jgi:hypothetical protein
MVHRTGYADGAPAFPKSAPMAARRDAWPPDGSPPGSNLDFTRTQHLDPFNVQLGLINPPQPSQNFMNDDLGNAVSRAMNDWQIEHLVRIWKTCSPMRRRSRRTSPAWCSRGCSNGCRG